MKFFVIFLDAETLQKILGETKVFEFLVGRWVRLKITWTLRPALQLNLFCNQFWSESVVTFGPILCENDPICPNWCLRAACVMMMMEFVHVIAKAN